MEPDLQEARGSETACVAAQLLMIQLQAAFRDHTSNAFVSNSALMMMKDAPSV